MDLESLKRVLTELKGEARRMRKEQLGSRFAPKEEALEAQEESPEVDEAAAAGEATAEEEMAPPEVGMDGEAPVEGAEAEGEEAMGEDDKAMLARVLAKHGLG